MIALPPSVAEELWTLEFAMIVPDGWDAEELASHISPDFHEIGASGRRLSHEQAVDFVRRRQSAPAGEISADLTRVSTEQLSLDLVLLTYLLNTPERTTRRSSIWAAAGPALGDDLPPGNCCAGR